MDLLLFHFRPPTEQESENPNVFLAAGLLRTPVDRPAPHHTRRVMNNRHHTHTDGDACWPNNKHRRRKNKRIWLESIQTSNKHTRTKEQKNKRTDDTLLTNTIASASTSAAGVREPAGVDNAHTPALALSRPRKRASEQRRRRQMRLALCRAVRPPFQEKITFKRLFLFSSENQDFFSLCVLWFHFFSRFARTFRIDWRMFSINRTLRCAA